MKTDPRKAGSTARRKLLKKIGAGSGVLATASAVPGEWSKPIVKGILLPAHAATTPGATPICNPEYGFFESGDPTAEYYCGDPGYYRLQVDADRNVDVQVEVSGTGVCANVAGINDKDTPGYTPSPREDGGVLYTRYKWNIDAECKDIPKDPFTAVFSITDSCEEPLVVKGSVDGCNE